MKKYELTEEHRAQLSGWATKWIVNTMSTKAMDDAERDICRQAVKDLYRAAKLDPPPDHRIVFVPSPFILRFAGGFAAALWYLKKGIATREATYAATRDTTYAATCAATGDATRGATYAATCAATGDATYDATYSATCAATNDATCAATWDATREATCAATWDATRDATRDATGDATREATSDATRDATREATSDATSDAAYAATYDATSAATRDTTWDATSDATWEATRDATCTATWEAAYDATSAATRDTTWDFNTWYRFPIHLMRQLSQKMFKNNFGILCAADAYRMWNSGNQWSGYVAYLTFFRYVAKLNIDYSKFDAYEKLTMHCGPRIMHEKFCMISDRPKTLLVDDRNRPHNMDGPFCEWRDGSALYAIHGIRVPGWVVETPRDKITKEQIITEKNVDVRRALIQRIGMKRVAQLLDYTVLDTMDEYELITFDIGDSRIRPWLKMICPKTQQTHIEGVTPNTKTVLEALAYRFGQKTYKRPIKEA